ncbi:vitellogenin-1-like isoform X2 [Dermacentor albipictus]|uniref:vitellogenin-1-like isoform X2 n=1 Tax=Dermacentor albipictus TaxID=60249 RepID=UPI0038FCA280
MEAHGTQFAVSSSCDRGDLDGAGEDEDIFKGDTSVSFRQPQITGEETNGGASAPSSSSSIEAPSTSDSGFARGSVAAENNVSSCATTSSEDNGSKRRTSKVATQDTSSVSEGDAGLHRSKRNQCTNSRTSSSDESKSRKRMAAKQKAPAVLEDDARSRTSRPHRGNAGLVRLLRSHFRKQVSFRQTHVQEIYVRFVWSVFPGYGSTGRSPQSALKWARSVTRARMEQLTRDFCTETGE